MRSLHLHGRMDLKNLISRIELAAALGVEPQTIAKWQRLGFFGVPLRSADPRRLYPRGSVCRLVAGAQRFACDFSVR